MTKSIYTFAWLCGIILLYVWMLFVSLKTPIPFHDIQLPKVQEQQKFFVEDWSDSSSNFLQWIRLNKCQQEGMTVYISADDDLTLILMCVDEHWKLEFPELIKVTKIEKDKLTIIRNN